LPKVRKEAEVLLTNTERQLVQIGPERSSVGQTRVFLTQISMDFYILTKAAADGHYDGRDASFFTATPTMDTRLRAKIHMENERFATQMRIHSAKRKIRSEEGTSGQESEQSTSSETSQKSDARKGQIQLTRKKMIKWVEQVREYPIPRSPIHARQVYHATRGRELPGNYNHALLSELFHEQCSRWADIAKNHLQTVSNLVDRFVRAVLVHVVADDQVRSGIQQRIRRSLDTNLQSAQEELDKILLDEQAQPITYNHYYTDNIQNARSDAAKKKLQDSMDYAITNDRNGKLQVSKTTVDLQKLSTSLQTRVVVDMTEQACIESLAALDAYYKV
jgi:hypothetical protein